MRLRHYILILCIVTFLTYCSSLWNQFVWDDEQFIYKNEFVKTFALTQIFTTSTTAGAGIGSDYYRPLTTISFAIDTAIWGLQPFPFRLTNVLLHTACGIFIFLLFSKLGLARKVSFVLALFFLVHPIQTEAVTYINSRGDSLYTFFGMLSALTFLNILNTRTTTISLYNLAIKINPTVYSVLTVLLYICTILSKEIGLAVIGVYFLLLCYTYYTQTHQRLMPFLKNNLQAIATILFCIAIIALYIFLRATALNFSNTFNLYDDGSLYSESIVVRLLTFTKVIWIYSGLLLFPYPLHMERSTGIVTSIFSVWPLVTALLFTFVSFAAAREYKTRKTVFIAFGSLWFIGMLIPVSGIIPINGILYEHWLYVPILGFYLTLYGFYRLLTTKLHLKIVSRYTLLGLYCLATVYALVTIRQNYFWSTPIRLYAYLLQYTKSARIYNNLGMAYSDANQMDLAISMYQASLQIANTYPQTYHNLANLYRDTNQPQLAIENYRQALVLQPDFHFSYPSLIILLLEDGDYQSAQTYVEQFKSFWPLNPTSATLEIILELQRGDKATAEMKYQKFVQQFPAEVESQRYLQQLFTAATK
jgi:tetratricopeptide (TPR) repeat protein